ncbi:alanine--glyoxylate aminotransferase 2, mitochondrial [Cylas formicarius]|uniref:alanine--glyoxylate aminotransferase 2, mitochondrial n=1 Tax=Cylas formicarius TaxID=197179 RepID=UPI0029589973|nr:alanine--glyoxylate aminotransferase 2, mitochondrial [Cylas formicarius]
MVGQRLSTIVSTTAKLPKCDIVPKKYTGPSINELSKTRREHLNPSIKTYYSKPLAIHQGHRQWLFDLEGKRYLDMFGGICTVSVGHAHPKISEAVTKQLNTLGHCSNVYYHEKIHEYSKRLAEKLPGDLNVIYFVNSGSEANDLAILLARCYTEKNSVMSLKNCYHGMTYQTMALTSNSCYKYPVTQNPGFYTTMNPDVYRGLWGGNNCRDSPVQTDRQCACTDECQAGIKYFEQFVSELECNVPRSGLAAFFAESIQGVGGAVQFPKNYIRKVYGAVKETGCVFVSDEVQAGFGRTGEHFWGFESHGIKPDIVTMAKGIGNGFPLAAVATTTEVAEALTKADHFNTFGGNPVSCTVGLTVLEIIEEESLQLNSHRVGTHLLLELSKLRDEFSYVGDVRGKGLMVGVELVQDKGSRKPIEAVKFLRLWEICREQGLIVGKGGLYGNVLRLKPPMCITQEDADFAVEVLKNALSEISNS